MRLNVFVEEESYPLEIPDRLLDEASDFFAKMDRDMDQGWQMSRDYVDRPDQTQRCQIVADRLLTALVNGNGQTAILMAAYILKRMPGITGVQIDSEGDMTNTEMVFERDAARAAIPPSVGKPPAPLPQALSDAQARERAEQEVSEVYKIGKVYRFATLDARAGRWVESPFTDSEDAARQLRAQALAQRVKELMGR